MALVSRPASEGKAKALKVRFLTDVTHGFKADTPGFEAKTLGDDYVTVTKDFKEGDEFSFPAEEADEVRKLIENGAAVLASDKDNPREQLAESHKDEGTATPVPDADEKGKPLSPK